MCLLVHQPKGVTFDQNFLADVYSSNKDGLGIMFAENGTLRVFKTLPKNAEEFGDFYRAHAEGRECIWHARMQTHGDIDFENCHPYRVTDRVYLAHNGVLSSGNTNDTSKSDTWHFIRNVIAPAVEHDESIILDSDWQKFIGEMIGSSNKFGLMTAEGDAVTINRAAGIEFNGAWLSNTYAWPAAKYNAKPASYGRVLYSRPYYDEYDWNAGYRSYTPSTHYTATAVSKIEKAKSFSLPAITNAARNCYIRNTLRQWVLDAPAKAVALVNAIEGFATGEDEDSIVRYPEYALEVIAEWFDKEEGVRL